MQRPQQHRKCVCNMPAPSSTAMKAPSLRIFIDTYTAENGIRPTSHEMMRYYDANPDIFKSECGESLAEANKRVKGGR